MEDEEMRFKAEMVFEYKMEFECNIKGIDISCIKRTIYRLFKYGEYYEYYDKDEDDPFSEYGDEGSISYVFNYEKIKCIECNLEIRDKYFKREKYLDFGKDPIRTNIFTKSLFQKIENLLYENNSFKNNNYICEFTINFKFKKVYWWMRECGECRK